MQKRMDEYTVKYLRYALFNSGEFELRPSNIYNDIGLPWDNVSMLNQARIYEKNEGWYWNGDKDTEGVTWGGC